VTSRLTALVVTSVAPPTDALRALAAGAGSAGWAFLLVGDEASPDDFELAGCEFYGLERQRGLRFELARLCPTRHYARKNLGYLEAIRLGAAAIVETDDDSVARPEFWLPREPRLRARLVAGGGWVNAYRYFTTATIWPRGFPLDAVRSEPEPTTELEDRYCPIQQGLIDDDPDVDAVYRLVLELPFRFDPREPVALGAGTWCPFNSQNTTWWPDAYPLLYLPATCSFRMTDIWRSLVAQRIAQANEWSVLFHGATVVQERNPHDLMRDFRDEVAGYLGNRELAAALEDLDVQAGPDRVGPALRDAYGVLVQRGWLEPQELVLVDAWLADFAEASREAAEPVAAVA
jgi:STELLO glycosyltransferases